MVSDGHAIEPKSKFVFPWKQFLWSLVPIVLTFIVSLVVFRSAIFEGYDFLGNRMLSDLLRANLPCYYLLYDSLAEGNFSIWKWSMGMGTSWFSHGDALFDPFTYLVFLGGRSNIPHLFVWHIIIKCCSSALTFYLFARFFKLRHEASVFGAVAYAFCGYALVMGSNFALGTIMVWFPLVLLGIERKLVGKNPLVCLVSLALIALYNYYYFFSAGLASVVYLVVRLVMNRTSVKSSLFNVLWLALFGVIAAALAAIALLPQIQLVLSSPRLGTSKASIGIETLLPDINTMFTVLSRLFVVDSLGNAVTQGYIGSVDYFNLVLFVSSLSLVLIVQLFILRPQSRIVIPVLFFGLFWMCCAPFFALATNTFSTLNYRWFYVVECLLALGLSFGLNEMIIARRGSVLGTVIASAFSLFFAYGALFYFCGGANDTFRQIHQNLHSSFRWLWIAMAMAVCGTLLFTAYFHPALRKKIQNRMAKRPRASEFVSKHSKKIKLALYTLSCSSLFAFVLIDYSQNYSAWISPTNMIRYNDGYYYGDGSASVIYGIKSQDSSWFRTEKSFESIVDKHGVASCNDPMAQKYYGLRNYNSLMQSSYVYFLQSAGLYLCVPASYSYYRSIDMDPFKASDQELNFAGGLYERYDLMSYLGVKYYVTKGEVSDLPDSYEYSESLSLLGCHVFVNNAAFPICFANYRYLKYSSFMALDRPHKDNALMNYNILPDDVSCPEGYAFEEYQFSSTPYSLIASAHRDACAITSFAENKISLTFRAAKATIATLSIPFDSNWQIKIDGQKTPSVSVNNRLLGFQCPEGEHSVEVTYRCTPFYLGAACSGVALVSFVTGYILYSRRKRHD